MSSTQLHGNLSTKVRWYHWPAFFLGGAFLINSVPHLVAGASGSPFQTPFTAPGLSSSPMNVLWAAFNLAMAYTLLRTQKLRIRRLSHFLAVGAGVLVMGMILAVGLGRLHGGLI